MLIFGYIGFDKPTSIDVGLVTHNPNPATAQLIAEIKKLPTFSIHEGTLEEEKSQLDQGNRSVILDVPDTTIAVEKSDVVQSITAYTNAGKAAESGAVLSILNQSINQMTLAQAHISPIVSVQEQEVNSHNLRYIEFLLPGLIALSIMQMSVFSVAFVFTQYKEKGTLKRLLATPMKPIQFVAANTITRLIVSVAQAAIFIVMGIILFHAHIVGSYFLIFCIVVLGAIMFLGLGYTISGLAKTTDSVPAIANLIVFPMLFLGGTFFPVSQMPWWLQMVAKFLPLTFFSTALRDVWTKGAGIQETGWNILAMVIWGVILISLATVTFRFQEKDSA
jgi:ABC-2 type transport system permease protein